MECKPEGKRPRGGPRKRRSSRRGSLRALGVQEWKEIKKKTKTYRPLLMFLPRRVGCRQPPWCLPNLGRSNVYASRSRFRRETLSRLGGTEPLLLPPRSVRLRWSYFSWKPPWSLYVNLLRTFKRFLVTDSACIINYFDWGKEYRYICTSLATLDGTNSKQYTQIF